jgi:hypothetical protein
MAITEEALSQIIGALLPPADGTDVQARDAALLVRLRDWVAEFSTPPKELRAERKQRRKAGDAREAALLKAFGGAEAAWRAMEDNNEVEVIRRVFEGFKVKRLFLDERRKFGGSIFRLLALAFSPFAKPSRNGAKGWRPSARWSPSIRKSQRPSKSGRSRCESGRQFERWPTYTERLLAGGQLLPSRWRRKRGGSWYLFATSLTMAIWGESSGGIVRAITEERTEFPYSVPSID